MKTLTALFTVLSLGLMISAYSSFGMEQASVGTATAEAAAQSPTLRLATLVPRLPGASSYSTPGEGSMLSQIRSCRPSGDSCRKNSQCCSGKCCTDDYEICEGWYGKCT